MTFDYRPSCQCAQFAPTFPHQMIRSAQMTRTQSLNFTAYRSQGAQNRPLWRARLIAQSINQGPTYFLDGDITDMLHLQTPE